MLKALYLRNFRNYKEATITFSSGVNAICGENAQGKTNLLEAIHVLMTGRSFRTIHLSDLIHFGEKNFYLEAHLLKNHIEQVLKISCDGIQRKIFLNSTPLPTVSSLLGILLGVILSPEDNELVKGMPTFRRQFLDLQIAKAQPLYLHHFSRYMRAMKQRNHLLKQKNLTSIEIWEEEMATSGAYIILERKKLVEELESLGQSFQKDLSKSVDSLQLFYKTSALSVKRQDLPSVKEFFLSQFTKHRAKEMELGNTIVGPHKDDLAIHLFGKEVRLFASEGQQRSCAAALRLAEWNRLKNQTEEIPLMCIDDIGISLDKYRENAFFETLSHLGQVFITSPRDSLPLPAHSRTILVHQGTFLT